MKKSVIVLSLLSLLVGTPVLAHNHNDKAKQENKGEDRGLKLGLLKHWFETDNASQFVVKGKVKSIGTNSFVVASTAVLNVPNVTNGDVTIKVDSNTKFAGTVNTSSISAASVGKNVIVIGKVNTDLLATNVHVYDMAVVKDLENSKNANSRAVGEVTAKTATSVTIKNSLTGVSKTIDTSANTKVKIDGETKTLADVNVGDKGWVKFKTLGTTLVAKFMGLFR